MNNELQCAVFRSANNQTFEALIMGHNIADVCEARDISFSHISLFPRSLASLC